MPVNQSPIVCKVRESGHVIAQAMPEPAKREICQLIYREVQEFFSKANTKADYEEWLINYKKQQREETSNGTNEKAYGHI